MGDDVTDEVTCQVCGKSWPSENSVCPDDGTWLHEQTIVEIKPRTKSETKQLGTRKTAARMRSDTDAAFENTDVQSAAVRKLAPPVPEEIGPGTRLGDYIVEAQVGEGAMGTVYRAAHAEIGKHVAIKVMTPKVFGEAESVKRFIAEARAIAAIEHIGIVEVHGFGRIPDGRTYIVMEWLEGKSLGERLKEGPLPYLDACEIIRQIARALEAAHAKGIIHRDLKPENVFLKKQHNDDDKPMIKLLDFGLAKSTKGDLDQNVARTRSGQMLGTPLYMSPEQCKNKGVDHRTDIYALGCMSYELLVGRTPFDADNVAELISAHLVTEPPLASTFKPDLLPELDKLLFNMVAKEPEKRPPLGEIRRMFGMQLSRPSGVVLTPPMGVTPLTEPAPRPTPVPLPPTPVPGASLTDEQMVEVIKRRPSWHLYAAIATAVIVIAVLLLLL